MNNLFGKIFICVLLIRSVSLFGQVRFPENIYDFIENPAIFELNQEPGRIPLIPYSSLKAAFTQNPTASNHFLSLNGNWKFSFANTPEESPKGFFVPGYNDAEWKSIKVPGNWEMQGFGDPMFRNVSQPFRAKPPHVPRDYNPVGCYRTSFEVPAQWQGDQVHLRMEGTTSASFVWVNGKEVGYNEGANEPAEYDLTPFLVKGKNILAVKVIKYSDGTYLEDQDFWRLAGIFRDVYLVSTPKMHIRDYAIVTDFDQEYKDATANVSFDLENRESADRNGYSVKLTLFDQKNAQVGEPIIVENLQVASKTNKTFRAAIKVKQPRKWSAETPDLYQMAIQLFDPKRSEVESFVGRFGFKKTEIRDQVFYLNGVAVKLNGVNSHMQHPELGHAMDEETIRKDFVLMKQFNINCVRTSHYPPVQRYLELADEYGIYIVDETGDESHATEFVSDLPEWRNAYVDRVNRMVMRDRNHPSILFWSAGNESGSGKNICEVIKEGKRLDPTRYWMYGGNTDDVNWKHEVPCEEIFGPRYPTPFELQTRIAEVSAKEDPRPSFMDEYVAATGNGAGGLDEYWSLIWRYPRLMGGAIWDWVSPGIKEPIRIVPDESKNCIQTALKGRVKLVDGKFGKAIQLNGNDQWVETYQDPALDIQENQLTLSFWVEPGRWNGGQYLIAKGFYQFGILQPDEKSLEFYLSSDKKKSVKASVPDHWTGVWHHVAGIYNGKTMGLYVDGKLLASSNFNEKLVNRPFPLTIGYNAEIEGQETSGHMNNSKFDRVTLFDQAIPVSELMDENTSALKSRSLLWLDFDKEENPGSYFSMGIGGRTYGLIWPDRTPQPELYQVKKSAQPVEVTLTDPKILEVEVKNRYGFTNLQDQLEGLWSISLDDKELGSGTIDANLEAGKSKKVRIGFKQPSSITGKNLRLLVRFITKKDQLWAKKGFEVAFNQFDLPFTPMVSELSHSEQHKPLVVESKGDSLKIRGVDFLYAFSTKSGELISIVDNGQELLYSGPRFNCWRAPLANETDGWANGGAGLKDKQAGQGNGPSNNWYALGLNRMKSTVDDFEIKSSSDSLVVIHCISHAQGNGFSTAFSNEFTYTISSGGKMTIEHQVVPHGTMPAWLPKVGLKYGIVKDLSQVMWNGRGPFENYPDRKTGAKKGIYQLKSSEFGEPYLKPQDYGCRTDVEWIEFRSQTGRGLRFSGDQTFNFSVQEYDTDHLTRAQYPYQLKKSDHITFDFDYSTSGVGCTAVSVLNEYRTLPGVYRFVTRVELLK